MRVHLINAPDDYATLLGPDAPDVLYEDTLRQDVACVLIFTHWRSDLEIAIQSGHLSMARDGMIWASWPKKASRVPSDITEDVIRELALPLGLVDVKVCAVNAIWSGLKLVIRKELR